MYAYDLMCLSTHNWKLRMDWYKTHLLVSTSKKQKTFYASVLIHGIKKPIIKLYLWTLL